MVSEKLLCMEGRKSGESRKLTIVEIVVKKYLNLQNNNKKYANEV